MTAMIITGKEASECMKDIITVSGMNIKCFKLLKEIQDLAEKYDEEQKIEYTEKQIKFYRENRCSYKGCPNLYVKGYIYCETHLYNSPSRIPQKVLDILDGDGL